MRQLIDAGHKFLAEGRPTRFRTCISYTSIHNEIYQDSTEQDLEYLREAHTPGKTSEESLVTISKELRELVKLLRGVQHFGAFRVESPEQQMTRLGREIGGDMPRWKLWFRSFLESILAKLE
jgi:hypothetical protein